MKSIKLRIHSMQNTRQITKAMEMVAASKMNKAQEKALRTRPYYTTLHSTLSGIAAATRDFSSPYLQKREEKRVCCVAIAGDRGLAGGYNSNVLRLAAETLTGEENCVVPIGKKAGEYFRHRGVGLLTEDWLTAENLSVGGCFTLARHLAGLYRSGQVDAIELVFTRWNSLLSQEPCVLRLLPLDNVLRTGLMVIASCPAGSLAAVVAKQPGTEPALASQAVAHSTICMLVTVPVMLLLTGQLFPL